MKRWLAPYVLCGDGRVIELNAKASCGAAGVDRLLTQDDEQTAPTIPACSATVSDPRPSPSSTITISIDSNRSNTALELSLNYGTTTEKQTATTDSSGHADVPVSISSATIEDRVEVVIDVGAARCATAFTPAS